MYFRRGSLGFGNFVVRISLYFVLATQNEFVKEMKIVK